MILHLIHTQLNEVVIIKQILKMKNLRQKALRSHNKRNQESQTHTHLLESLGSVHRATWPLMKFINSWSQSLIG